MIQDEKYWQLHKKVYLNLLDEVDAEIRAAIISYPYGEEAEAFNEKVNLEVEKQLEIK